MPIGLKNNSSNTENTNISYVSHNTEAKASKWAFLFHCGAFCKNCDSRDQWEFWQEQSSIRVSSETGFCLKKKKKPCFCIKFLLFPLCGVWGKVGRRRLLSMFVEHCNLK